MFGVLLSAWLLNEADTLDLPRTMIALLFVVAGVLIINLHITKKQPALQTTNVCQQATNDNQTNDNVADDCLSDEQVMAVADEILDEYNDAFEELAK